jgi:hypothetical protein
MRQEAACKGSICPTRKQSIGVSVHPPGRITILFLANPDHLPVSVPVARGVSRSFRKCIDRTSTRGDDLTFKRTALFSLIPGERCFIVAATILHERTARH